MSSLSSNMSSTNHLGSSHLSNSNLFNNLTSSHLQITRGITHRVIGVVEARHDGNIYTKLFHASGPYETPDVPNEVSSRLCTLVEWATPMIIEAVIAEKAGARMVDVRGDLVNLADVSPVPSPPLPSPPLPLPPLSSPPLSCPLPPLSCPLPPVSSQPLPSLPPLASHRSHAPHAPHAPLSQHAPYSHYYGVKVPSASKCMGSDAQDGSNGLDCLDGLDCTHCLDFSDCMDCLCGDASAPVAWVEDPFDQMLVELCEKLR
jgi:hypothetical protein